jgi:predicted ATPase
MRLMRLWVDGFRNLKDLTVNFDPSSLTTVILGQNGTGKSYLLEAIALIFRAADLDLPPPDFRFSLSYNIKNRTVTMSNPDGKWMYLVDGSPTSPRTIAAAKAELFPDTVFAYYSGTNHRMEAHFDLHQQRYYRKLIEDTSDLSFKAASIDDRRLFYARPIHGVLALMCLLTMNDPEIRELLHDMIGITGFHSAMLLMRKPWYAKGKIGTDAGRFWGATGRPGRAARLVRESAFYPMAIQQRASDDYRSGGKTENQYAIYLRNEEALAVFAQNFADDLDLFEELESIDISDLYRWVQVWVHRAGTGDGDISYGEMSEGERQLLTVLGLIRLSRSKQTLFLLDEPDTHLNPRWQYDYLSLIERWAGSSGSRCQILLTTHNPLMIGSLRKNQVRALARGKDGRTEAREPEDDPIGIGVEGLLKSELFGLRSTLAPEILAKIDRHYCLLGMLERTPKDDLKLRNLAIELNELGVSQTHPNPYFEDFAKAMARQAPSPTIEVSREMLDEQKELADEILKEIQEEERATESRGASVENYPDAEPSGEP